MFRGVVFVIIGVIFGRESETFEKMLGASPGRPGQAAEEVLQLAAGLQRAGHTVILISHDMRRVAAYARRCILLKDGRVLRDAPVRDVFADAALLAQANLAAPPVTRLAQAMDWGAPLTPEELYLAYTQHAA